MTDIASATPSDPARGDEPDLLPKRLGVWSTLGWGLLVFAVTQAVGIIALAVWNVAHGVEALAISGYDGAQIALTTLVINALQVALLIEIPRWRLGARAFDYLALTRFSFGNLLIGVVAIIAVVAALDGISHLVRSDTVTPFETDIFTSGRAEGWLTAVIIAVVVVGPIGEEVLFRGFLFRGWVTPGWGGPIGAVAIPVLVGDAPAIRLVRHEPGFPHRPGAQLAALAQRFVPAHDRPAHAGQPRRHGRGRAEGRLVGGLIPRSGRGAAVGELQLRDGAVAAAALGGVERAVAALEQARERLAGHELRDADRYRDPGEELARGTPLDLTARDELADALRDRDGGADVDAGQNADHLLAAVPRRQILVAHPALEHLSDQAQDLIAELMAEPVVELLEVVDIDQKNAQRLAALHRRDLPQPQEVIERMAVGEPGQGVGAGTLLYGGQRAADLVQLLQGGAEIRLELRGPRERARQLGHQALDDFARLEVALDLRRDAAQRRHMVAAVRDRGRQIAARGVDEPVQLLGNLHLLGGPVRLAAHIGEKQAAVRFRIERALVGDKDVDDPRELGRGAEREREPGLEVLRRRRHVVLGHELQRAARRRGRALEIGRSEER